VCGVMRFVRVGEASLLIYLASLYFLSFEISTVFVCVLFDVTCTESSHRHCAVGNAALHD
jgi:hypothetical protein